MAEGRVPRTIARFASYLNDTDVHLQSNRPVGPGGTPVFELLGLTSGQADGWNLRRVDFRDNLYPKWTNKNTKTETVNEDVADFMEEFFDYSEPLLNIMAASTNAINQDANIFNMVINRKDPTRPTEPIEEVVVLDLNPVGGGTMRVRGRQTAQAKRGKIPETAKAIEVCWTVGTAPPASPLDCTENIISSRSTFTMNVGAENHNLNIYAFARWIDTSNAARAGAWTELSTRGIL